MPPSFTPLDPAAFHDLLREAAVFGWDCEGLDRDAHGSTWSFTKGSATRRVTADTDATGLHAFLSRLEREQQEHRAEARVQRFVDDVQARYRLYLPSAEGSRDPRHSDHLELI